MILEKVKENIINFKELFLQNKITFCLFIIAVTSLSFAQNGSKLAWTITLLSSFSSIINNSFQIFGTLIATNKKTPTWKLWLFITSIFIITITLEWIFKNNYLDFERLEQIPYQRNLNIFHFLSPIILIILTCKKIPISTTFLLLVPFAPHNIINSILAKTAISYLASFVVGFVIYDFINRKTNNFITNKSESGNWIYLQLISTALLWISWIMSNNSNIVVFLPRKFSVVDLLVYIIITSTVIFFVLNTKGGKMQEVLEEKDGLKNIKSNAILNLIYAFIIYFFQFISTVPVATTWAFIGLLGGRELALVYSAKDIIKNNSKKAIKKIVSDFGISLLGIIVSLLFIKVYQFCEKLKLIH